MYSRSTAYFCFSVILWTQLVKTSNLCHKVIFCIFNKMAGNLCARKTEQSAEETSFEEEFGSQEGGKKKSSSKSILAPVCYSVCYWVTSICSSGDSAISHALLDYAKHHQCFLRVNKLDIWGAIAVHCAALCYFREASHFENFSDPIY